MKNIILLGFAIVLLSSCNNEQRYTQNAPEIETYKAGIKDYTDKNWESLVSHYADTANVFFNTNKPMKALDIPAFHKNNETSFSSRKIIEKGQEYEMVVDNKGRTWVNFWGSWQGTLAANNKQLNIPVHLTAQFINGKIVREYGYWDNSPIVLAIQEIEAAKNMSVEEKTLKSSIETVVKAWNTNDKNLMASAMADNFVRTENGNVIAKGSAEYGTNLMDVFHGSFPDFKVKLNDYQITENKIHINWTCTGTNTKPFQGNPATNKAIVTHGHSIWTIQNNGKFSREDAFYDNLTLYNQLGYTQIPPK